MRSVCKLRRAGTAFSRAAIAEGGKTMRSAETAETPVHKAHGGVRLPPIFILTAGCLWGTIGIFVRQMNEYGISSLQITFFRALVTSLILIPYLLFTGPERLRIRLRDVWCFLGTGIGSIVFFNFCYFQTILLTSLSVAAVLLYTAPIFVMLLSAVLFGERITAEKAAALVLAFSGCAMVTGVFAGGSTPLTPRAFLLGLGSGLGYALYSIFGRYALRRYGVLTVTAYTFLFAALGCLPLIGAAPLMRTVLSAPGCLTPILGMGIFASVVPYLLYTKGLGGVETGRASILASVEPVVATLIGVFVYREDLTPYEAAGAAMVLAAVALIQFRPRRMKTD